jgi:hypothetical protein
VPPDHVHFNGSVNLADCETVMREIASRVPAGLHRRVRIGMWGMIPVPLQSTLLPFGRPSWQTELHPRTSANT